MTKVAFIFIFLLALGFGSWYFARPDSSRWLPQAQSNEPDMILAEMHATKFTPEGHITQQLYTPKLLHYSNDNKNFLLKPRVMLKEKDQSAPWDIQAQQANTTNNAEIITLSGNVILQQAANQQNAARTIETEKLIYYPKKQVATTNLAITLKESGLTVQAIGMEADLEQEKVNLLSKVSILRFAEANNPDMQAHADKAQFFAKKQIIFLEGNAEVKQGQDSFRAPQIEYDVKNRHVVSNKNNNGRTTIIIHPKQTQHKK